MPCLHLALHDISLHRRIWSRFLPLPLFPNLVVCAVCGDPIGRKSFLRGGYVDLSVTDHVTHQPL